MHRAWLALLLVLAMFSTEDVSAQAEWPEGVTRELVRTGRSLFEKEGFCYTCHGYQARGGAGPDLTDAEWWHSDGSFEGIVATILRGVPADEARGGPASMMLPKGGTQLSEEQVRAIAAFLWRVSRVDSLSSVPSPG